MNTRIISLLIVCCLFFSSAFGVGRLFVDEITGYTNEDVTTTNVVTPLLVTDSLSVENGVAVASGDISQFVDTPGTINFNVMGSQIDFQAFNSIEITSLGENVAFSADSVSLSGTDVVLDSVDISIATQDTTSGTIGGTFTLSGTDVDLLSYGYIDYSTENIFLLESSERVRMTSHEFRTSAGADTIIQSDESNIFVKSLLELNLDANTINLVSDSGLEIGSGHGNTVVSAQNEFQVLAENFIYTTENNVFNIDDTMILDAQSLAGDIFMYTERAYFSAPDGEIIVESTDIDSQTAFLTSGTIESDSNILEVEGRDITIISVDATTFTTRTDFTVNVTSDAEFLASGGIDYQASNVLLETLTCDMEIGVAGKSYFTSVSSDLLMNAGNSFTYTSGSTSISSSSSMELNSDDFLVNATNIVDFFSYRDILVNADALLVNANGVGFDSHELSTFRSDDITMTASQDITVASSGDVIIQNTADVLNTAISITYSGNRDATLSVFEILVNGGLISFESSEVHISTGSALDFTGASNYNLFANDARYIANNNINIERATYQMTARGENFFESFATSLSAADDFEINSFGNIVFTSDAITAITTNLDVDAQNILFSAIENIDISGAGTLTFDANSLFLYGPASFDVTNDVTINILEGTFAAGSRFGDEVRFTGSNFFDTHPSVTLGGGFVNVNIDEDITFGVLGKNPSVDPDVLFEVAGERDLVLSSNGVMNFVSGENFLAFGSNLNVHANGISVRSSSFVVEADSIISFNSNQIDFESNSEYNHLAHSLDVLTVGNIITNGFETITLNTQELLDFGSVNRITLNAGVVETRTRDIHITSSSLTLNTEDVDFVAGDGIDVFFETVDITGSNVIAFDADDEFNSHSEGTTMLNNGSIDADVDDLTVIGGSVSMIVQDNFLINSLGDITIGNTKSTSANINLGNTHLITNNDYIISAQSGSVDFIATGNEVFESRAITMVNDQFSIINANGLSVDAFKGINFNAPVLTVDVSNNMAIDVTRGAISALITTLDTSFTTVTGDITFISSAEMIMQAFDDVIFTNQDGVITAVDEINMYSEEGDINFIAGTTLSFVGNALTLSAGKDEEEFADIVFDVSADTSFSFGDDVRIEALGNTVGSSEEISFIGGDVLGHIQSVNEMSFFPSGTLTIDAALNSTFTALTGSLSFGSRSARHHIDGRADLDIVSGRDFSVQADGAFGTVFADIGGDYSMNVTGSISGSANGTVALFSDSITAIAGTSITLTALNDKSMIYSKGTDYFFETTGSPVSSNIDIIGKNSQIRGDNVEFFSPQINIGGGTPRITSRANSVEFDAIGDITFTTSTNLLRYQSGGLIELLGEDGSIISGDEIYIEGTEFLSLTSDNIQMTAANSAVINVGEGLISHDPVTLTSIGTGGMKVSAENPGSIVLLEGTTVSQTFTASNKMFSEDGFFASGNAYTSNSETLIFDSDFDIEFSTGVFDLTTTGNSAKIAFLTEGIGADIQFFTNDFDITSGSALTFSATGETTIEAIGTFSIAANGANSGKIINDASNNISFLARNTLFGIVVAGDIDFETTGDNSNVNFNVDGDVEFTITDTIAILNEGGEGGSIIFESESQQTSINISATEWQNDIDGNYNIDTLGRFNFVSNDAFELASGGYAYLGSAMDFDFSAPNVGDTEITAENGDIKFIASTQSPNSISILTTGIVSNSDTFSATVIGNSTTGLPDPQLGISSTGTLDFTEENGDFTISAYSALNIDAGTFVRMDSSANNGVGVTVTSNYPGGDFKSDSTDAFIVGENINAVASSDRPESGYVRIIAGLDDGVYAAPGTTDLTSVIISSGLETSIQANRGDVRFEFSSSLIIDGGDLRAIAGDSIEFKVRGDGRAITGELFTNDGFNTLSPSAISIHDVSGVQFLTENDGDITLKSGSAGIYIDSEIIDIQSDTEPIYIESSGAVSFMADLRSNAGDITGGVDFISTSDVRWYALDESIDFRSRGFFVATTNVNSEATIGSEGNAVTEIDSLTGDFIWNARDDINILNDNHGDIHLETEFGDTSFTFGDSANFEANNDMFLIYSGQLSISATNIIFDTNRVPQPTESRALDDENGFVRISGTTHQREGDGDDVPLRPAVRFPTPIQFDVAPGNTNVVVSQGAYCEVNRAIGFGITNQDGNPIAEPVFCACVDHVWLCIMDEPTSNYYYDRYNEGTERGTIY